MSNEGKKYNKDERDKIVETLMSMDKMEIVEVFRNVAVKNPDIFEEEENSKEDQKYKGEISGFVPLKEYNELPYLGQQAIYFMEEYVGFKEGLTFEGYFQLFDEYNKNTETPQFKNFIYRLRDKKVFTIESLKHIIEPVDYRIEIVANQFKDKSDLSILPKKTNGKGKKSSKYSGNIKLEKLDDVVYDKEASDFIEFLNELGKEGYTFEMMFQELINNENDENAHTKIRTVLNSVIKKGKVTWPTIEKVFNSLGMEARIEFVKEQIDGDHIKHKPDPVKERIIQDNDNLKNI